MTDGQPPGGVTLDEIRNRFGFLLRRSWQSLRDNLEQSLYDYWKLTSTQHAILTALDDHGKLDQASIARLLMLDRTNTGIAVQSLLRKGLIERKRSKTDKRRYQISLSAKAVAAMPEIQKAASTAHEAATSRLTHEERATLKALLQKLADPPER